MWILEYESSYCAKESENGSNERDSPFRYLPPDGHSKQEGLHRKVAGCVIWVELKCELELSLSRCQFPIEVLHPAERGVSFGEFARFNNKHKWQTRKCTEKCELKWTH